MRFPVLHGLLLAVASITADAALYDRGNGMIYDDVLDITWLQDANYAKTSGYDSDGIMTWEEANAWADQLVYGGYSDWRLTSARVGSAGMLGDPIDGLQAGDYSFFEGEYDNGWGVTSSELGYMYYVNLQNLPDYFPFNSILPGRFDTDPDVIGLTNTSFVNAADGAAVSFLNLQGAAYWYQEPSYQTPGCVCTSALIAWYFDFNNGYQDHDAWRDSDLEQYVLDSNWLAPYSWAVRDGDVSPVPIPAAAWLFSSALMVMIGLGRRQR